MATGTQVLRTAIGTITLDVVTDESHTSDLEITENPVESGAEVADHAVLKPPDVVISGTIVSYEPPANASLLGRAVNIRSVSDFLDVIGTPGTFESFTADTVARANRELTSFVGSTANAVAGIVAPRALAPWLPDFSSWFAGDESAGENRIAQIHESLLALQKSGSPIEVQTMSRLYEDMLLKTVAMEQSSIHSAVLTVTCRRIFIVETKRGSGLSVASGTNKSGRASKQSASATQKGNVQGADASGKKSAVRQILDYMKGT
ncbi:phage baseplate protein [Paraburkholderia sp. MM5477-R1]|uniref:phage baseplate protein n=1 Tax=Paraburkholderia sp. MM5477-R1 TaxID=2991062 RepID=UPI003D21B470